MASVALDRPAMMRELVSRIAVASSIALAIGSAVVLLRRRAVYVLGRRAAPLAPGVLVTLWLAALALGERTRSLELMAFVGAAPLAAAAFAARKWTSPRRLPLLPSWTRIDWIVVGLVAAVLLVVDLFDVHCHRAVAGAFLRGNIPPSALNDPRFPLPYHALFDGVVALVMRTLPVDTELALDLVGIGCVALTMNQVSVLSRIVFRTPAAAQVGRVLFFLGFGPTFLRYLWSAPSMRLLHGDTTQAYIDIILRRPTALGLTVYTLCLALLAPLFAAPATPPARPAADRKRSPFTGRVVHPLWLAPAVFVMPQLAEEMILHLAAFAAPLVITRRIAPRWTLAAVLVFSLGALVSGVFGTVLGARTSMATPHLALSFPPTLPTWAAADRGVPLFSAAAVLALLAELGPLLAATYLFIMVRGPARDRALLAPLLAGLAAAVLLRLEGWNKADLDRFLFTGTPVAFMLVATWVDVAARRSGSKPAPAGRTAPSPGTTGTLPVVTTVTGNRKLALALGLVMAGPPAVYAAWTALDNPRSWRHFWRDEPGQSLREELAMVGSREPILTDRDQAYSLVQAGFIVLGPMTGTSIGNVDVDHLDDYLKANADRAEWLFLPEGDSRLAGRPVVATRDRYRLVRARGGYSPPPGQGQKDRP